MKNTLKKANKVTIYFTLRITMLDKWGYLDYSLAEVKHNDQLWHRDYLHMPVAAEDRCLGHYKAHGWVVVDED